MIKRFDSSVFGRCIGSFVCVYTGNVILNCEVSNTVFDSFLGDVVSLYPESELSVIDKEYTSGMITRSWYVRDLRVCFKSYMKQKGF